MLASQGLGFVATLLILMVSAEPMAASDSLIWAAIAGTSGVTGLALFYLALSRGTMGLVGQMRRADGALIAG